MTPKHALSFVSLLVTFGAGYACAALSPLSQARADTQSAFDRALAERLVRAQEEQTREQEGQRRALEAISRNLERLKH